MEADSEKKFRVLVAAAQSDGEVADSEEPLLLDVAESFGLDPKAAREMIATPQPASFDDLTDEQRTELFGWVCRVVAADSEFGEAEQEFVSRMGHSLGLDVMGIARVLAQNVTR